MFLNLSARSMGKDNRKGFVKSTERNYERLPIMCSTSPQKEHTHAEKRYVCDCRYSCCRLKEVSLVARIATRRAPAAGLDMFLKSVTKPAGKSRVMMGVAVNASLILLVVMAACSHAAPQERTKIKLDSRFDSAAQLPHSAQQTGTSWKCPVGDPPIPPETSPGTSARKVSLSWHSSTSESDPKFGEIRYCVYRTKDGPVKEGPVLKAGDAPCKNCELVTPDPVVGTTYIDKKVDDDASYCYVAIAVSAKGALPQSVFSNPAGATIKLGASPFSCEPKKDKKKGSSTKSSGHR